MQNMDGAGDRRSLSLWAGKLNKIKMMEGMKRWQWGRISGTKVRERMKGVRGNGGKGEHCEDHHGEDRRRVP